MNLKILIVDDDPIVLYLHRIILEDCNIAENPIIAENGKIALETLLADNNIETNYLVFLDINMPIMGGWDFLEAIQTTNIQNKIFVVMVTSSLDAKDYQKAKSYPQVISYLEKPLNESVCTPIKSLPQVNHFFEKS